ncbi:MAG: hypothetical protein IT342_23085 [Candidatus Melainabacteria bacterium]|nr:hypothetical protein [Candidatus Melainabacteria bacterium]
MSLKQKLDARFLRLKGLADRLEPFTEGMVLVQSNNQVVAGEALVGMALAKQAAAILSTACQSMGFNVQTLSNPLPTRRNELEQVISSLAGAAQAIAKTVMKQFGINQDAAVAYLPVVIDEMSDHAEEMIKRAETHFATAKRANVASVPQADGDDGQLTDATVPMVDPK